MSTDLPCFKEARNAWKAGAIELDEFLRHIVAHYGGLRHEADVEGQRPYLSASFEDEVRKLVLNEKFLPLNDDDAAVIHSIFLSGFQGDATAVRKLIESSSVSPDHYIRPLLRISTDNANAQLLRVCFENGFAADDYNGSEHLLSSRVRNKPSMEWLDVLYDFDYRQWRSNSQQLGEWRTWRHILFMGADCTRWWLAHGGRTPRARSLFEHSEKHWPGDPTIRILFDQFGIDWFKDSGTLQLAAENHDIETVKMLVEADADVNEEVTDWHVDYREGGKGPLPALHMAVYAKSEEVIRYLAEHGARLERRYITDRYNTLPKEYRPFMDLVNDLGAVKEETSL